jgi:transposase
MAIHPKWATKHRRKGTELRLLNGKYYLYEVSSKWDPELKRSKKISGKLLGKITEKDGFIESDKAKLRKRELVISRLSVKEYGIVAFIDNCLGEYTTLLKKHFPKHWQEIIALAYCKLVHKSPLKNVEFHYLHSYLSEQFPGLKLSGKQLSGLLREIGVERTSIIDFFKEFGKANDNILFDGTDLISNSNKMEITKFGKSKKGTFVSLANIMFIFSVGLQLPVYYRILPGNIKDIKAFKLCLEESKVSDAVIIADKGFYSENNIDLLKQEKLKFIVPLRRNNLLINYDKIKTGDKQNFENFFKFENRIIWYYVTKAGNENINVYLDEELKTEEIKDYLYRIDSLPEEYNIDEFHSIQYRFGTIALMNNLKKKPEQVFADYKSRSQIETMIDALKNIIDADKSYMQNEQALEAWMFVNHIALHWYYKILQLLKSNDLNNKYAPMDLILFLKEVKKVKINDKWHVAEITQKSKHLLDSLKVHIT